MQGPEGWVKSRESERMLEKVLDHNFMNSIVNECQPCHSPIQWLPNLAFNRLQSTGDEVIGRLELDHLKSEEFGTGSSRKY